MNKLMAVVAASVCAVSFSGTAVAEEKSSIEPTEAAAQVEEDESAPYEAGVDLDFFSAYVWRNAVQTDRMVVQPCVWADLTCFEPFWIGFSIWQNYDITSRRRGTDNLFKHALNETDYNVHAGVTAWEKEDLSLAFELGHDWYTYQGRQSGESEGCPDTREIYLKVTFANPIADVYGQISWLYDDFGEYRQALHYEIGFNKEVEICESLTLGADWNINFGDGRYLSFLYGGVNPVYDAGEEEWLTDGPNGGIGGTTIKVYLTYDVTDWLQLGATLAYTGVLNGDLRDSYRAQGADAWYGSDSYPRDLLWGGFSARFSF